MVYANVNTGRGSFSPCNKVWHGRYYRTMVGAMFPIAKLQDKDGLIYLGEEDKARFKCTRERNNLMIPFQCDLCHFRNLKGANPKEADVRDQNLLVHLRQAILGTFWSRKPRTVNGN